MKDEVQPRFYMDHGVIHDRVTGKHVVTDGKPPFEDSTEQVCEFLNGLVSTPTPIADSSAQKSAPSSIGSLPSGESDPSVMLGFDGADTNYCLSDSSEAGTGRDAYVGVLASLAAAISLLERTPRSKKAAASDKMFDQMVADYKKALKFGRDALADPVWVSVAKDIHHVLDEGDGHWRGCSGCHELSDGAPTGPYSDTFRCHLGLGCSECGGIGAVWDNSDYSEFTEVRAAPVGAPTTDMLLAGARSIGASAHTDNHVQRAKECWHAMQAAMNGVMPPKPSGTHPPAPAVGADDVARALAADLLKKDGNHGCLIPNSAQLDSFIIRGHVDLTSLADAVLSLLSGQGGGK